MEEIAAWFDQQHADGAPACSWPTSTVRWSGYTCWSTFRGGHRFPGYRHTAELTVHVDERRHGQGVGRALLEALIAEAPRRDIHVLVAAVDADNAGSIAFHRSLGFAEVARMPEVGRKFDRWLDLVLLQRVDRLTQVGSAVVGVREVVRQPASHSERWLPWTGMPP